jgi:hypothetical protein
MLPANMKMEFLERDARHFVDESFLCYDCWTCSWCCYFIRNITGLGTKPVMAIVQKSSTGAGTNVIAGLATGMISTFPTVYCLLLQFGLLTRLQDFME